MSRAAAAATKNLFIQNQKPGCVYPLLDVRKISPQRFKPAHKAFLTGCMASIIQECRAPGRRKELHLGRSNQDMQRCFPLMLLESMGGRRGTRMSRVFGLYILVITTLQRGGRTEVRNKLHANII